MSSPERDEFDNSAKIFEVIAVGIETGCFEDIESRLSDLRDEIINQFGSLDTGGLHLQHFEDAYSAAITLVSLSILPTNMLEVRGNTSPDDNLDLLTMPIGVGKIQLLIEFLESESEFFDLLAESEMAVAYQNLAQILENYKTPEQVRNHIAKIYATTVGETVLNTTGYDEYYLRKELTKLAKSEEYEPKEAASMLIKYLAFRGVNASNAQERTQSFNSLKKLFKGNTDEVEEILRQDTEEINDPDTDIQLSLEKLTAIKKVLVEQVIQETTESILQKAREEEPNEQLLGLISTALDTEAFPVLERTKLLQRITKEFLYLTTVVFIGESKEDVNSYLKALDELRAGNIQPAVSLLEQRSEDMDDGYLNILVKAGSKIAI